MLKSYKDLIVYQKGYELSLDIYKVTNNERYGLISQTRRSAVSIPCNTVEGYLRNHIKEYIQFAHIAYGSSSELETLLSLSRDLDLTDVEIFSKSYEMQEEVSKLLRGLIASLSNSHKRRN